MQFTFWFILLSVQKIAFPSVAKVIASIKIKKPSHRIQLPLQVIFQREIIVRCCGSSRCLISNNVSTPMSTMRGVVLKSSMVASSSSFKSSTTTAPPVSYSEALTKSSSSVIEITTSTSTSTPITSISPTIPHSTTSTTTTSLTSSSSTTTAISSPTTPLTTTTSTPTTTLTTTSTPTTTPTRRCNGVLDRTCRPKTTCIVDTNLVTQLQSTGKNYFGNMITTGNGKQYFVGVDWNALTFDSATSICCQMGLKLAEFPTEDSWNNFMATFKTFTWPSWDFFGETEDNGNGTDTWCISRALVPAGVVPAKFYDMTCGTKNLLVLTPGGVINLIDPNEPIHRYYCE